MKKYILLIFILFVAIPCVYAADISSSYYKVDSSNKVLYGVKQNTNGAIFGSRLSSSNDIAILNGSGQSISDTTNVRTGYKISLNNGTITYDISVLGDIKGEGKITKDGVNTGAKYIVDKSGLSNAAIRSADYNSDGNVKMNDMMMLLSTVNNNDDKIHFIRLSSYYNSDSDYDSTHGDAMLLESNGHYAMVDTGISASRDMVIDYLKKVGVKKLDFILITHLHSDHYGGARAIVKKSMGNIPTDKLYLKRYSSSLPGDEKVIYHGEEIDINSFSKFKLFLDLDDNGTMASDGIFKDTQIIYMQDIDKSTCPTASNQASLRCYKKNGCTVKDSSGNTTTIAQWGTNSLAKNCTSIISFEDMDIKLYNTGYVMRNNDIDVTLGKDTTWETYNANYETVYLYITVNNKKIVLAGDGLGNSTTDGDGNFPDDVWYNVIKKDADASEDNHIDILKAPHHGTYQCAYRFRALYPDAVVVPNSSYNIGDKTTCIDRLKYYYTPTIRYTDNYAPAVVGGTERANGELAANALIAGFNKSNGKVAWCTDTRTDCSWN